MEVKRAGLKLTIQKTKIMTSSPITSWQTDGVKLKTVTYFIFFESKITGYGDCSHELKIYSLLGKKAKTNLDNILKSRDITLPAKVCVVNDFSSSHVRMWELVPKEGWELKNWCFQIVMLDLGLQGEQSSQSQRKSTLNIRCKDWCWSWAPILWPPDEKHQLIRKNPDAGKDWRQKEKRAAEEEMVG